MKKEQTIHRGSHLPALMKAKMTVMMLTDQGLRHMYVLHRHSVSSFLNLIMFHLFDDLFCIERKRARTVIALADELNIPNLPDLV